MILGSSQATLEPSKEFFNTLISFGALHGLSGLLAFSGNAKQAAMLPNRGHGKSELETRGLVADSGNLLGMPLGQQSHGHPPALWCAGIIDKLSNTSNPATCLVPAMPG